MKSGRERVDALRLADLRADEAIANMNIDALNSNEREAHALTLAIASDLDTLAKAQEAAAPLEQWLEDFDKFAPHTASSSSDWAVSFLSHGLNVSRLRALLTILRKPDHG